MNDKIEKDGITAFRNFISETDVINDQVQENDKYPSWDGELLFYKSKDWRKANLKGRIPVQIKSRKGKWKSKEKFSVNKEDLENYLSEGGCLYIRPVFLTTTKYRIYTKMFLTDDIKNILPKFKSNKTKSIEFAECSKIKDFKDLLDFFLSNRNDQLSFKQGQYDKILEDGDVNLQVKFIKKGNPFKDMMSEHSYVYLKNKYDMVIPTNLKFSRIGLKKDVEIRCNNRQYFRSIEIAELKGGITELTLNTALKLVQTSSEIKIDLSSDEGVKILDYIEAANFLNELKNSKQFSISGHIFKGRSEYKEFPDFSFIRNWMNLIKFLDDLHLELEKVDVKSFIDNEERIVDLYNMIVNGVKFHVDPSEKDILFHITELLNKKIIIYLKRVDGDKYSGKNFMSTKIDDMIITQNDTAVFISQYLGLKYIYGKHLKDNMNIILGYEENVYKDLIEKYLPSVAGDYNQLAIDLISCYDMTNNICYLELSRKILLFLKNNDKEIDPDIVDINIIQIKYRLNDMEQKDIEDIYNMKERKNNFPDFLCCIHLLLNEITSFKYEYDKLPDEKKEEFVDWPIYELYKE